MKYRSHWYWVDDNDFDSKRVFAFLMILMTVVETGTEVPQPVITELDQYSSIKGRAKIVSRGPSPRCET